MDLWLAVADLLVEHLSVALHCSLPVHTVHKDTKVRPGLRFSVPVVASQAGQTRI